jgi:uncharacterized damage-inducible protein DinB
MTVERNFLECSAKRMRQAHERIEVCIRKLDDEQIWLRTGDNANACGNLCLHLAGNVRQWILHGVGGQPDLRIRDAEFAAPAGAGKGMGKEELLAKLRTAVEEACALIESLPEARLTEVCHPQNYTITVLEAIYHVVEHFSLHTGQIIFLTKAVTGEDLGFYAHLKGAKTPPAPPKGQEQP